ncbi:MAG: sigma-54-dependent Fis family transcriptional regulator [Deltaproteobacteria bacterium]|nr:sigma-54-dependent Fis family transcriptional regulator [Deltaproteobacteria bacterium]
MKTIEGKRFKGKILVVDDEERICEAVKKALERIGYVVETSFHAAEALEKIHKQSFDMVICDIKMPGMDGITLLDRIKEYDPTVLVLMITGYASIESAVDSMKKGAHEYIPKPFSPSHIRFLVERAFERRHLVDENLYLKGELKQLNGRDVVIGKSDAMQQVFDLAAKVAETDSSVLITGESGTGKEVVARLIHFRSLRANAPFVTVNCSAIPENLLESELFGHKKGAFTGALYSKRGSFELANGGTFFLDEIGDMRLEMQAKILRVLEERMVKTLGSEEEILVDVRVIAATNKELSAEIYEGRFREDLFYRLNIVQIAIPPLREHKIDIPTLARHFLKVFCTEMKKPLGDFSEEALNLMMSYDWPGNVRELKNTVERAVIFANPGELIRTGHFPPHLREEMAQRPAAPAKVFRTLEEVELDYIREVLLACDGNRIKAAEILGISPSTIWRKLQPES